MTTDFVEQQIQRLLHGGRSEREAALARLHNERFDVARLVPVLEHPHVSRQIKAIEVLRTHHTREAVELLVPFLGSQNPLVRTKTTRTLGRIGKAAPDLICAALDAGASGDHRIAVLDVLSRLGHPRGLEVLLVAADEWDPSRRIDVLDAIRRYRDTPPIETIRAALFDREVRMTAIRVAGKIRHPSFLEPLLDLWLGDDRLDYQLLVDSELRAAIRKYGDVGRAAVAARERAVTGEKLARIRELAARL